MQGNGGIKEIWLVRETNRMYQNKGCKMKKACFFVGVLFSLGLLTACGQESDIIELEPQKIESTVEQDKTVQEENSIAGIEAVESEKANVSESTVAQENIEAVKTEEFKKMFGENCIAEQTFEVELSEYDGKVYFVPFAPSGEQDLTIQIIQDGEVLAKLDSYVPRSLAGEAFTSLDAVSFYDVNYDNNTDIVLIETYGNTSFATVYYGFDADAEDYSRYFYVQEQLSENLTSNATAVTISEIRNLLADGKKNGSFSSYQEAYRAVSNLCELERPNEIEYNLIYFDGDEIPELVSGVDGYYNSLYTYHDGTVYTLMDEWPYGAMGNAGYEYVQGKNSLRNYNTDYAGAILYTTYMAMNEQYDMEVVAQITTYNFDDVNENGMPDENEEGSLGYYSKSYLNGKEASTEECEAFNQEGYEYIQVNMSVEDLKAALNN